jgi:uncharacterized protein (DUF1697 family)
MTQYVALLRGINVGGQNVIRMTALGACFETLGFRGVATYIHSGNVIFSPVGAVGRAVLTRRIEAALAATFDYQARVVVRSLAQLRAIVGDAPAGFGARPSTYRYDVVFLREPLTAPAAAAGVSARAGVDRVWPGQGVLYFARLIARVSQSHLPRLIGQPVYQQMTLRNWNTTTRLLERMERAPTGGGRPVAPRARRQSGSRTMSAPSARSLDSSRS